ncbi:Early light-induced protein, chloroplastic-like protein [Drosera capensis]
MVKMEATPPRFPMCVGMRNHFTSKRRVENTSAIKSIGCCERERDQNMAMTVSSMIVSPVSSISTGSRQLSRMTAFTPILQRAGGLRVRCNAIEPEDKTTAAPSKTPAAPTPVTSIPPPPRKPKVSTNFGDVFAFSGPAPERINGRLAMIGFVAALAVELAKGSDVFSQISDGGVQWFIGTSVLLSVASLIPLFQGVTAESKSDGLMTSDAELINGRAAMLGLLALAFTEYVKGGALI